MINIKVRNDDLVIESGNLVLVEEAETVAQDVHQALKTWRGECEVDVTRGMNWMLFFQHTTPYDLKKQLVRDIIAGVSGTLGVSKVDLEFDVDSRSITITWTAKVASGTITEEITI